MKDCHVPEVLLGKRELLTILAISMLGLLVRLYQLGTDSLWFDEIGVAIAIRSPNIVTLFENVRSHVMAMPLDYVVGWLFIRSCQSEACLRLPAALWGALTIPVSYFLFRKQVDYGVAALGALILALCPLHIQYSQELRFYSSLAFFYILSTLLLIRAFEHPTFWRWLQFTLIIIVGSYFHLYVYLVFINGFVWIFFSDKEFFKNKKNLAGLFGSFFSASFVILPGYLYFRSAANYGMFFFAEAIINIMIGFGWLPANLFPLHIGFIWYPLFIFFQLIGFLAFRNSRNRMILSWVLSSVLQVGLITIVNGITQYALRGRQLLMIMPLLCLLVAQGILKVYKEGYRKIGRDSRLDNRRSSATPYMVRHIYRFGIIVIGIMISILGLQSYYHLEKSNRRGISTILVQKWKPGDAFWFTPAWENKFYGYYFNMMGHPEIENALKGTELIKIPKNSPMPKCWVTDNTVSPDNLEIIIDAGFKEVITQTISVSDTQLLFCR